MPLLPTGQIEEKHPKSKPEPRDSNDFYMKLPRLLPSYEEEETSPEYKRLQNIKSIVMIILFVLVIYFLHLKKQGL